MRMAEILVSNTHLGDGLPMTTPNPMGGQGAEALMVFPQNLNLSHSSIHEEGRAGGLM